MNISFQMKGDSVSASVSGRCPTRLSRSDKLHDRPFREQHGTAADNASAFISSAITESDAVRPARDPTV
jgi:hypothetical protein